MSKCIEVDLVTFFGNIGYRNAKLGTVDEHIGVCAFGKDAFLRVTRKAESQGFEILHVTVDSM